MTSLRSESNGEAASQSIAPTMKRRGLIAGAAALAAGMLAKQANAPVDANTGDFLKLGTSGTGAGNNSAEATTVLTYDGAALAGQNMLTVTDGTGLSADPAAIAGFVENGKALYGVYGFTSANGAAGVLGAASSSTSSSEGVRGTGGGNGGAGVLGIGGAKGSAAHAGSGMIGVANSGSPPVPGSLASAGVYGLGATDTNGVYGISGTSVAASTHGVVGVTNDVAALTANSVSGVYGESSLAGASGVLGFSSQYVGVFGITNSTSTFGAGVTGQSSSGSSKGVIGRGLFGTTGIYGASLIADDATFGSGIGVSGRSGAGPGVQGISDSSAGVYGVTTSGFSGVRGDAGTASGASGVLGVTTGDTSSIGVKGTATNGTGVYGTTTTGLYGVRGDAGSAPGSAGLLGYSNQAGGVGFGTVVAAPATTAGFFGGRVVVNGDFAVTGTKSAAVKDTTGNYRLMYCVESPESWFEDFGDGTLSGGKATITLDRDFAAVVHTNQYHVFLTPKGDTKGLYVTAQSASGFEVHETQGGTRGVAFSWRVVAKRADVKAERLAKFELPFLKLPEGVTLPNPPPVSPLPASPPATAGAAAVTPAPLPAAPTVSPTRSPTGQAPNPAPPPRTP